VCAGERPGKRERKRGREEGECAFDADVDIDAVAAAAAVASLLARSRAWHLSYARCCFCMFLGRNCGVLGKRWRMMLQWLM
jgi:hypothetical protein